MHEGGFTLAHDGHGGVTGRNADGRLLHPRPSAVDPLDGGLERRNAEAGLAIDAGTITTDWAGERLDLDLAVQVLVQADGSIWLEEVGEREGAQLGVHVGGGERVAAGRAQRQRHV